MTDSKTVAFDIRDHSILEQTPADIMAVLHLHIDTADTDATGSFVGVQYISVFHAQQIYHVREPNDYRAVNWNTGQNTQIQMSAPQSTNAPETILHTDGGPVGRTEITQVTTQCWSLVALFALERSSQTIS